MDFIDCALIHPFTCLFVGATQSGKTYQVVDLIRRRKEIIDTPLDRVIVVYSFFQPIFHTLESDPSVVFTNNIEDLDTLATPQSLVVCDDQMDIISKNQSARELMTSFFIKKSHHLGISTICLVQNMYADHFRDINRNTNYIFFFDLQSDKAVLVWKGRQCAPGHPGFLLDAYQKAMDTRDFSYLMLDFHPRRKFKKYWARSHLDPVPEMEVYVPK